jgi:short-subunit dehydrogenase
MAEPIPFAARLPRFAARRWRDFSGRSALITGASRGLGLALARELTRRKLRRVALLGRDRAALAAAGVQIERLGAEVQTVVCDLRERTHLEGALSDLLARWERIDVLINNAGIIRRGAAEQLSIDDYAETMAVHFWAPLHAMRALIPRMRTHGGGRIVNISSLEGKVAFPQIAASCASKFALTGLSNALRAELARERIYVTTVAPGLMFGAETNWRAGALPLISTSYERAARRIARACLHADRALELDGLSKLLIRADALAPGSVGALMELAQRALFKRHPEG